MKKALKIWLIVASSLVLLGAIIFTLVMTALGWDFTKLLTTKFVTSEYTVTDSFNSISLITSTADVTVLPSNDSTVRVVCYEEENIRHNVSVKDGSLCITVNDTRKWYQNIGINFESPKITIYLPKGEYSSLSFKASTADITVAGGFTFETVNVKLSTGDTTLEANVNEKATVSATTGNVSIKNVSIASLDITVTTGDISISNVNSAGKITTLSDTGDVSLEDVKCQSLISDADTGKLSLTNVIATESFQITRDTGDVSFNKCDAAEIFVKTTTGKVKGSLLSSKVFIPRSSTGDIRVPSTTTGGKCEITTGTGDIIITVNN